MERQLDYSDYFADMWSLEGKVPEFNKKAYLVLDISEFDYLVVTELI